MNKSTPDKLYHGSPVKFNKFDISKIGSNTNCSGAGIGFYFTTSIEQALSYGKYIYVVDFEKLKLKKSLSNFKRTLNGNQIIYILDSIFKITKGEENYFENFDDYQWNDYVNESKLKLKQTINQEIINSFISWNDTDIIASFINSGTINPDMIFNILHKMGYNYTMDQYDDSIYKNSQHYILYFEPKIEERLTFKDKKSFEDYIENIQI